jgi:hypothetical protein
MKHSREYEQFTSLVDRVLAVSGDEAARGGVLAAMALSSRNPPANA